jgi:hypothetical protein
MVHPVLRLARFERETAKKQRAGNSPGGRERDCLFSPWSVSFCDAVRAAGREENALAHQVSGFYGYFARDGLWVARAVHRRPR